MVEGLHEPPDAAPKRAPSSRSPLGAALFALVFALGATLATLALAAALSFVGLWSALALGFFVAVGLPLFLVLRVSGALKRRGMGGLARVLIATLLSLATHAALFGVSLDWVGRSVGDLFLVAEAVVSRTVGEVPLLSGILKRGAEEATVSLDGAPPGDAGPAAGDGGVAAAPDGGPAPAAADDGRPSFLSPRTDVKRPAAGVVSLVRTSSGGYAAVVTTLDAGGVAAQRTLDLNPFSADGGAVAAAAARDGSAAFVTGDGSVVYAGPGEAPRALPALGRGAKLPPAAGTNAARSLRAVRDVAIGPGGALLLVADVVVKSASDDPTASVVHPALLSFHPRSPTPVLVLRQGGDLVPEAAEGSVTTSYRLGRAGPAGRVAVVEGFLEGGDGASNDERLLAGRVDEGALLQEIARSGDAVVGLPQRALARFEEASALADGRVLFGASFLEEGAGGSLFVGRPRQPPQAVAGDAVRDGKAPWPTTSPTLPQLVAEPDGRFAFVKPGAGIVLADVDQPLAATLLAPGVRVYQRRPPAPVAESAPAEGEQKTQKATRAAGWRSLGRVSELSRPTLAQGGDWLLAGARLEDGRRALLLLSRDDVKQGAAEALLVEGEPLPPVTTTTRPKQGKKAQDQATGIGSIRSLMLYDWRTDPAIVTSP